MNHTGSRLPRLREIAPEYYCNLAHHTSWSKVIYQYIVDPTVGPYARVKRQTRVGKEATIDVNGDADERKRRCERPHEARLEHDEQLF